METEKSPLLRDHSKLGNFLSGNRRKVTPAGASPNPHPIRSLEEDFRAQNGQNAGRRKGSVLYRWMYNGRHPPCPVVSNDAFFQLSDYHRWTQYGLVPWKSCIQIVLIFLFVVQIGTSNWGVFFQGDMRNAIHHKLFNKANGEVEYAHGTSSISYYSLDTVLQDLKQFNGNFFQLEHGIMGMTTSLSNDSCKMVVTSGDRHGQRKMEYSTQVYYPRKEDVLGSWPYSDCSVDDLQCFKRLHEEFIHVERMDVYYDLQTWIWLENTQCYDWKFKLSYTYSAHRASMMMKARHEVQLCKGFEQPVTWPVLDYTVIALSITLIFISIRSLLRPISLSSAFTKESARFARQSFMKKVSFANQIPASSKSKAWHMLSIAASLATLLYSVLKCKLLMETFDRDQYMRIFMGIAAFLNSLCVPQYFYKLIMFKHYKFILTTVNRALPQIIRVIICFVPIMLGYVMVGTIMFGNSSDRFSSLCETWITLFSVANGDEIRATITSLYTDSDSIGNFGCVFIISYVIIFIYVVLAIIISIMERAYMDVASEEAEYDRSSVSEVRESVDSFLYDSTLASSNYMDKSLKSLKNANST